MNDDNDSALMALADKINIMKYNGSNYSAAIREAHAEMQRAKAYAELEGDNVKKHSERSTADDLALENRAHELVVRELGGRELHAQQAPDYWERFNKHYTALKNGSASAELRTASGRVVKATRRG